MPTDPFGTARLEAPAAHDFPPLPSPRRLFLEHWAGRLLLGGLAVRLLVFLITLTFGLLPGIDGLRRLALLAIIVGGSVVLWRVGRPLRQRLLWRVRRKLILSYFFIGVVPAALSLAFFLIVGALAVLSFSSYLVKEKLADLQAQGRVYAEIAAVELQQTRSTDEAQSLLTRKTSAGARMFPGISMAQIPMNGSRVPTLTAGAWDHGTPPTALPEWLLRMGPSSVVLPVSDEVSSASGARLVVRSVSWVGDPGRATRAVIVDLPLDDAVASLVREETGIKLGGLARMSPGSADPCGVGVETTREAAQTASTTGGVSPVALSWVNFLDVTSWESGATCKLGLLIQPAPIHFFRRITEAQAIGDGMSFGDVLLLLLLIIGSLFLVIQAVAIVMGVSLARSITGAIHELFEGTQRVQANDLTHRVRVRSRDQFGTLASSFNTMVSNIEELLEQKVVKERLQQELQIARDIQTSLLPSETLRVGHFTLAAACRPAREIGGDYCDFFPLEDGRIGVLVADVSGKGASAALYMAELKGLMLALSKTHLSPRSLLAEVNRVLSSNLGRTSFVTMTYGVLDVQTRTLTHARAGHTPLIHLRAGEAFPRTRLLAPEGLVLGVRMEPLRSRFEGMLHEHTLTIGPGDVLVLFTDGISEAMNSMRDLYGEDRLCLCVEEHASLEPDALCDAIFESVRTFADGAEQHDDMTLIVLKASPDGPPASAFAGSPA